jgi:hypothetical protein
MGEHALRTHVVSPAPGELEDTSSCLAVERCWSKLASSSSRDSRPPEPDDDNLLPLQILTLDLNA